MHRQLPLRWRPALTLWNRGDLLEDIAISYGCQPATMQARITELAKEYPGTFEPRTNRTTALVTVTRLVPLTGLKASFARCMQNRRLHALTRSAPTVRKVYSGLRERARHAS